MESCSRKPQSTIKRFITSIAGTTVKDSQILLDDFQFLIVKLQTLLI